LTHRSSGILPPYGPHIAAVMAPPWGRPTDSQEAGQVPGPWSGSEGHAGAGQIRTGWLSAPSIETPGAMKEGLQPSAFETSADAA